MAVAPGEVVFDVALGCHILAGLTGVASAATAALAAKRPGRHPRAGRVYLWAMAVVFVTATTMSLLRLARNWHLLLIALVAAGLAGAGYLARRRRP